MTVEERVVALAPMNVVEIQDAMLDVAGKLLGPLLQVVCFQLDSEPGMGTISIYFSDHNQAKGTKGWENVALQGTVS